jgi:ATP-dependent Clp protease ATP-binding subunit ClpB
MQGAAHIKEELERTKLELETAHRAGDLGRMSELQYGRIPELEKQLAEAMKAESKETTLLRNNVTEEEVAEIVSSGPASRCRKCWKGEKEKLLQMESIVQKRVVGQTRH